MMYTQSAAAEPHQTKWGGYRGGVVFDPGGCVGVSVIQCRTTATRHSYKKFEKFLADYLLEKKYRRRELYVPPSNVYLIENKKASRLGEAYDVSLDSWCRPPTNAAQSRN